MAKGSRTRFTSSHVSSMSPRYGSFRLCACDGSNENCRYCFGTGRISAHFEKAKAGSSARRGKATSKIPNEKLVFLPPITSVKGPRVAKGKKSRQNRKPVDPDWIKCPKCLVNVRTYRIAQHDEEKHGRSRKRALTVSSTKGLGKTRTGSKPSHILKSSNRLTKCTICHWEVSAKRLIKHVKKVHGSLATEQRLKTAQKTLKMGRPKRRITATNESRKLPHDKTRSKGSYDSEAHLVSDLHEGAKSQRMLDQTRPYAHAFRERGRYGSHPAHDGFDDESTP